MRIRVFRSRREIAGERLQAMLQLHESECIWPDIASVGCASVAMLTVTSEEYSRGGWDCIAETCDAKVTDSACWAVFSCVCILRHD